MPDPSRESTRRRFVRAAAGAALGLGAGVAGAEESGTEVSAVEDLMREHGLLERALLVYQEALRRLETPGADLDPGVVAGAARFLRLFVEDYHEKLEERHVFPLFEGAGRQVGLVRLLWRQHDAGRLVTDHILELADLRALRDADARMRLAALLRQYLAMYRPHAAREDTEVFPHLRRLLDAGAYAALGERFEAEEKRQFGADGFARMVGEVVRLETAVGIHDLAQFTPR